jgi:hypothetical protein
MFKNMEFTMKRLLKALALSVLLVLIASGCTTVGPDYEAPTAPVETEWLEQDGPFDYRTNSSSSPVRLRPRG